MADKMMRMAGRAADGLAKAVRVNGKGVLGVSDLIGAGPVMLTHTATMTAGQTVTLLDSSSPWIVDDIDWIARHETDARIFIEIKGAGNGFIDSNGTGVQNWLFPKGLLDNKSLLFDIVQYDTTVTPAPKFRFHLKKPLYCPLGVKITLMNNSTDKSFLNSCQVRGRVYLND